MPEGAKKVRLRLISANGRIGPSSSLRAGWMKEYRIEKIYKKAG